MELDNKRPCDLKALFADSFVAESVGLEEGETSCEQRGTGRKLHGRKV